MAGEVTNIFYTLADQVESVVKDGTTWDYYCAGADEAELAFQDTPQGEYAYADAYGRRSPQGIPIVEGVERTTGGQSYDAATINDPGCGDSCGAETTENPWRLTESRSQPSSVAGRLTP